MNILMLNLHLKKVTEKQVELIAIICEKSEIKNEVIFEDAEFFRGKKVSEIKVNKESLALFLNSHLIMMK